MNFPGGKQKERDVFVKVKMQSYHAGVCADSFAFKFGSTSALCRCSMKGGRDGGRYGGG